MVVFRRDNQHRIGGFDLIGQCLHRGGQALILEVSVIEGKAQVGFLKVSVKAAGRILHQQTIERGGAQRTAQAQKFKGHGRGLSSVLDRQI